MEARRDAARRPLRRARPRSTPPIDRMVWYAGWADKLAQVLGSSNPVAGPYFNFTVPEPTGVVGILCPEEPPLARDRLADRAGDRRRQHGRRRRVGATPARRGRARRGARHLGPAGRRGQHPDRLQGRARALARRAHGRERDRRRRRATAQVAELERLAAENVKRVVHGDGRRPEPVGDRRLPRAEDGLAPDRPLAVHRPRDRRRDD